MLVVTACEALLETFEALPTEIFNRTQNLRITLALPPNTDSIAITTAFDMNMPFISDDSLNISQTLPSIHESTKDYEFLSQVVTHVNRFKAVRNLEVVLEPTKGMTMSIDHLNLFLPFYSLKFVNWDARWKMLGMGLYRAENVRGKAKYYINLENSKIIERLNPKPVDTK